MQKTSVSTNALVEFLKANKYQYVDVSLLLQHGLLATHTISFRKTHIRDEGIDNFTLKWQSDEFLEHYKNAVWVINYVPATSYNQMLP
ncbi:MAG: hypothetical protein PHQ11_01525 [Paludibacter sp.]|nr:hypothetical protein [Paludibacter sp.]MDD4198700.1 hypothetical protein [Paludibacter sp.]MDD4427118.1 hypothetical protein [Paludibacter sp.]